MKSLLNTIFILLAISTNAQNIDCASWIFNTYSTADGEGYIEFYETEEGKINGKIVWLKNEYTEKGELKRDVKNPDKSKRGQEILGLDLIVDMVCEDAETLSGGSIYDSRNGKIYDAEIYLKEENTIELRGYIFSPRFGKSVFWTLVENQKIESSTEQ